MKRLGYGPGDLTFNVQYVTLLRESINCSGFNRLNHKVAVDGQSYLRFKCSCLHLSGTMSSLPSGKFHLMGQCFPA